MLGVVGDPDYDRLPQLLGETRELANQSGGALAVARALQGIYEEGGKPLEERWDRVDALLTIGGDGTLLRGARMAGPRGLPLVGCNTGRLGFLTTGSVDELDRLVDRVVRGAYEVEERQALNVSVGNRARSYYGLNDVVVHRGGFSRLITLRLRAEGRLVGQYSGDGILLSTATGSTAYSLSAGGPVLHPSLEALVATPICPHTLAVRPLVLSGDSRLTVEAADDGFEETVVTVDGQTGTRVQRGERVSIRAAVRPLRLIRFSDSDFFTVLRRKMTWGDARRRED